MFVIHVATQRWGYQTTGRTAPNRVAPAVRPAVLAILLSVSLLAMTAPASAALGDCGQPVSNGATPTAPDCLFILQSSVGGQVCEPSCICDVNGNGSLTAADGLFCLQVAVGEDLELACPCNGTPSISVDASVTGDAMPGAAVMALADIDAAGGCVVQSIQWSQLGGTPAAIQMGNTATATVVFGSRTEYKDTLFHVLAEPPIGEDDLPPNVPFPGEEFPGGLVNRFYSVGLNPFTLEETGLVTLQVTVTASCGVASDTVEIHTQLPWTTTTGLHTVPIGVPVVLHGRDHVDEDEDGSNDETGADVDVYDWTLASRPAGSNSSLVDADSQNPELTPDVEGVYTVQVTDNTRLPGDEVVTIQIHAGTWEGVVTGQDENGRPVAVNCEGCHDGEEAPDKFTPWKETGHAEILTNNLNTNANYSASCFPCHSVGFDPEVDNGGFEDASDYQAFLNGGLLRNPSPDNWTLMLENFPAAAQLANVQCENCHGPQRGARAHMTLEPRISLSADVCATCHGEPLRHARYQQWQLSAHANYELAVDEGESGNCSRCHTVNGFLAWLPILEDDDPETDPTADITVTWTADDVHPQTCVTCHDPHEIGTVSGIATNAVIRVSGNTPPLAAGFQAFGVGDGAMCMTCHNSRRGLHNDDRYDRDIAGTSETSRAPHGSVQADLLMGQNAYLVNVGIRGNHSLVTDTCVNCHMERTPPPDLLSYNLGGTNHTFFASNTICSDCHGAAFDAEGVQEAFAATIDILGEMVEEALIQLMDDEINAGNVILLSLGGGMQRIINDVAEIADLGLTESRGRFALTFTFTDMSVVSAVPLNNIFVRSSVDPAMCPMGLERCELFDFADERLVKVSWNWLLLENDGSQGIHNPAFALEVLDASMDALIQLAEGF